MLGCEQGSVQGRQPLLSPPWALQLSNHRGKTSLSCSTRDHPTQHSPWNTPSPETGTVTHFSTSVCTQPFHEAICRARSAMAKASWKGKGKHRDQCGECWDVPRRQGWQLWNPPLTSLPAGNSGIIPNTTHRQGTLGSLSTIPVVNCGTPAAPGGDIPSQNIQGLEEHPGLSLGVSGLPVPQEFMDNGNEECRETPPEHLGHCRVWSPWQSTGKAPAPPLQTANEDEGMDATKRTK